MNNIRTQGDVTSANSARTTLSYSAVAMKKNPASANNNRTHTAPKPATPQQPALPDVSQPVQQLESFASLPAHNPNLPPPLVSNVHVTPVQNLPSTLVTNGHSTPIQKTGQPSPSRTPEALAAAKQQVIQDAKKKASLGHGGVQTPPLLPSVTTLPSSPVTLSLTTSSPVTSPIHQQSQAQINQQAQRLQSNTLPTTRSHNNIEIAEKTAQRLSPVRTESSEKSPVNTEIKSESPITTCVSPKDQRSRGDDGKQFLMKFGKIHTAAEGLFIFDCVLIIHL